MRVHSLGLGAFDNAVQERLLRALAEQLKLPLIQIARDAELAQQTIVNDTFHSIETTADMALQLIDSYLLSIELQSSPSLDLEPVSMSAVLQDTAHHLHTLAKQYHCNLEVHLKGKYQPVMAHRRTVESAYAALGYAFVEGIGEHDGKHRTVTLGAHQSVGGLVAGMFTTNSTITADAYKRGRALFGTARQALPSAVSSAGAGIFVADSLLSHMNAPLHVARHNYATGLAATLSPSHQLILV